MSGDGKLSPRDLDFQVHPRDLFVWYFREDAEAKTPATETSRKMKARIFEHLTIWSGVLEILFGK